VEAKQVQTTEAYLGTTAAVRIPGNQLQRSSWIEEKLYHSPKKKSLHVAAYLSR